MYNDLVAHFNLTPGTASKQVHRAAQTVDRRRLPHQALRRYERDRAFLQWTSGLIFRLPQVSGTGLI